VFTDSTYKYALDSANKIIVNPRMIVTDGINPDRTLSGDDEIVSYLKEKFNLLDDNDDTSIQQQNYHSAT
jgi:hypothetical protein